MHELLIKLTKGKHRGNLPSDMVYLLQTTTYTWIAKAEEALMEMK